MNHFYVPFLSMLLLVSPGISAVDKPWSEQDVLDNVVGSSCLGFFIGFSSIFWHPDAYKPIPPAQFLSGWFGRMGAGTCIGGLLGYYFGSQKTAPALYKKAAAYIPLTDHRRFLLLLAQDYLEAESTHAFLEKLNSKYNGNIVTAFNDYVEYRNDLTKALELFEVLKEHEQVTFFIKLIQRRMELIDAALGVIKEIPTFPYPMTLPY